MNEPGPLTVNQLLERLQEIRSEGFGDFPIVSASDDEWSSMRLLHPGENAGLVVLEDMGEVVVIG